MIRTRFPGITDFTGMAYCPRCNWLGKPAGRCPACNCALLSGSRGEGRFAALRVVK